MDEHIRTLRKEELLLKYGGWFDEENAERAVSWLVAAEDRRPVVLVGAGFTLNARDRKTGLPATQSQAPLWGDVGRRLAGDLGISADRYDAPTLFEMYQEALGDAKLRDALRDALDDAALDLGDAHKSLATYPCEAIVTTNCLDTLLDRACGASWRRVVLDADLSTSGQRRDLIYLHGHRDFSDSWVMTRSQYEDFARTRPVVVARVRQLLAQHPWLIVGFGMGDPNFHALMRLLGFEMRGHQPLSLALMPQLPLAAERQHWRRLGIEMCAPSTNGRSFGEFLAWAFPKFSTQYSPTSDGSTAFIERGLTPEERLRRFRQVNPAPIVERDEVYRAWKAQLDQLLTEEERASAARDAQTSALVYVHDRTELTTNGMASAAPYAAPTQARAAPPLRSHILQTLSQESTFDSIASMETTRYLDRLLAKNLRAELAEHFAWALEHQLFESAHPRGLMELVAIHLAKDSGWKGERIEQLIRSAAESAHKYQQRQIEELLAHQVHSLGLTFPAAEHDSVEPSLLEARTAYRAFMNTEFASAAERYELAAQVASAAGREFEAWAYMTGRADAVECLAEPPYGQPSAPAIERERAKARLWGRALRDQVQELAHQPTVKHWLHQADARSRSALRETIEANRVRERSIRTGTRSMRWSEAGHALWKSYRDLQAIYAPPLLQGYYIGPLLPFLEAEDVHHVLSSTSKPQEWLEELLYSTPGNLSDRKERDRDLVQAILADAHTLTKSERLAALRCSGRLTSVIRMEDVPRALDWLKTTAEEIGPGWQQTPWGSRSIADDCWRMFTAVAHWADESAALAVARGLVVSLGSEGAESAQKALYDLPWQAWKLSVEETAKGYLALLTSLLPSHENGVLHLNEGLSYSLFALMRMLEAGLAASTLKTHIDAWQSLLNVVKQHSSAATRSSEAKRAGFLLEREFARLGLQPSTGEDCLFTNWFPEAGETDADKKDSEEVWASLNDALETTAPSLVQRLRAAVGRLVKDEENARHYGLNPHLASPAIRLLTRGLVHLDVERNDIASFLVGILETAPKLVTYVDGVLHRELWDEDSWNRLKNILVAACGGVRLSAAGRDDPGMTTRCQAAVLELARKIDSGLRQTEPALWHFVQGFGLAAVNDERVVVANQAAFAVVKAAMDAEAAESSLYASAIERIAADARVEVRSALANGGVRLAARARDERIRQAARKGIEELEKDDNAQVTWLLAHARVAERSVDPTSAHKAAETP